MTFNILEHIHDLEIIEDSNTQYTIRCPICLGKIRIKKSTGVYHCFGAECPTYLIRRELGLDSNFKRDYYYKPYVEPLPIPLAKPIILHDCDFIFKPNQSEYLKDGQKVIRTVYEYDDVHHMIRLDYPNTDKKKDFYPLWKIDDRFVPMGDPEHPFFNHSLIKDSSRYVLFVEGEKNAITVSQLGILALTVPSFCYTTERLEKSFEKLFYAVKGVVVVPDNDPVGFQKALRIRNACYKVGISCLVLNFTNYYEQENDDLVNLIERGIDVKTLLEEKINESN